MLTIFCNATIECNKATVRGLLDEVINTGRFDLCGRYLSPDRIDHQDYGMPPGMADGHDGFQRVLGTFREAFPDLRLTIEFMMADGEKVVAYITTTGTHLGPFMGALPTGRRFKVTGVDIFAFNADGLVSDYWGAFDALGVMRQLGLLATPSRQEAA